MWGSTLGLFVLLYLTLNLLVGFWAARRIKTTQDFVIAGRNLSLPLATTALFATWFGSETILGASSEFVEHGLLGVIEDPFGAALCLVLVGLFFARRLYRLDLLTLNDYFRLRYGRVAEFLSSVFMIPSYFGWIAAQLVALAVILQVILAVPFSYGILLGTIVVFLYTLVGGLWAVSITDFLQSTVILIGLLVLANQLVGQAGGFSVLMAERDPDFLRFFPKREGLAWVHYFAAWITIGLGSIPQQDVFQRVMAAKNERTAVRASFIGGMFYLSFGFLPLLIGWAGSILYPELQQGDTQLILPQIVLQKGGIALQVLFFGALLSAILSTTSGAMLAPATVLGENLVKPFWPQIKDHQLLLVMRLSLVFVAICSCWMAFQSSNIYDLVAQSSALSLVSLFVPLTAGLYWKQANNLGCLLSMSLGMGVWIWFEFYQIQEIPALLWGLIASILGQVLGAIIQFLANNNHAKPGSTNKAAL